MSKYTISNVCPKCGSPEYAGRRKDSFLAFLRDRVCKDCKTQYTPPMPAWAAVAFILVGLLLGSFVVLSFFVRLLSGYGMISGLLVIEVVLAVLGVLAIIKGVRALINSGKV